MSSIKNIITLLDNELQLLIAPFNKQINELRIENEKLHSKIISLSSENNKLQDILSSSHNSNNNTSTNSILLNHIKKLSAITPYDILDDLHASSSFENTYLLLLYCKISIEEKCIEKTLYILNLLNRDPKPLQHEGLEIQRLLTNILDDILLVSKMEGEPYEEVLKSFIKFVSKLYSTELKDRMTYYLLENFSKLMDIVLYMNEPEAIISLLHLLMKYDLNDELEETLSHIITIEWPFLDYNVSNYEFCIFLWYAYLFDLDEQLIGNSKESLIWLADKQTEFQLYNFVYDCLNSKQLKSRQILEELMERFRKGRIFHDKAKRMILEKVQESLRPFKEKNSELTMYSGKLFVVPEPTLNKINARNPLQLQVMLVPLYKNKQHSLVSRHIKIGIYFTKDNKMGYITTKTAAEIKRKYSPEKLNFTKNGIVMDSIQINEPIKPQSNHSFQWPSTEIQEKSETDSLNQTILNEKSALKKLGYQITGLTREKRWKILQTAVPSLGLKKVAYTIAYNVRLRKGQANGTKKFQYAITEWEYDLSKLKKAYYKNDFNWPRF